MNFTISKYQSPIGTLQLLFCDQNLQRINLPGLSLERWLKKNIRPPRNLDEHPTPLSLKHALDSYFRGQETTFDYPLEISGTPFQKKIWEALITIPFGETTTYKRIGEKLELSCYRAIGQAVGANPIPIIIPCHRVLASNGLGGFAGGLNQKKFLLILENSYPADTQLA